MNGERSLLAGDHFRRFYTVDSCFETPCFHTTPKILSILRPLHHALFPLQLHLLASFLRVVSGCFGLFHARELFSFPIAYR
jgi:hypothetical protein